MRKEFQWPLLLIAVSVAGLIVAGNWRFSVLENDALWFSEHSSRMLAGELPYFDFEFEHLPVAIIPILTTGLLAKALGMSYAPLFWLVMTAVVFAVGILVNKVGDRLGVENAALSWVGVSWALIPLAVFRLDAISVALTMLALYFMITGSERASAWAMGTGIAAKGWPIVLSVVDWWRTKRVRAIVTVAATIVGAVALASLPLFRSGREFFGVHMETVTGAAVAFWRMTTGEPLQSGMAAGATYIGVGTWALVVNAALGIALGASALRVLRRSFEWRRAIDLLGVVTIALMLVSPLLSAQFIFWITPFAALSASKEVQLGTTVAVVLTGLFVTTWLPGEPWWWGIIVVRNVVLLWTGLAWSRYLTQAAPIEVPAETV